MSKQDVPSLVKSPIDGRTYDFSRLFEFLDEEGETFEKLAIKCEVYRDFVINSLDGHISRNELFGIKHQLNFLAQLRDAFRHIDAE